MYIRDGYFLHLLRLSLLPSGIILYPKYAKYRIPYVIIFCIFMSTGLCGITRALFIPDASKTQIMETVYALNIGSNVLEFFGVQQLLRKKLIELYIDIQREYLVNDNFAQLSDRLSREFARKVLWIALWLYIAMNIPPLLIITVTNTDIRDMRALSFPLWCPWRIDTIWKYLLTMGIEVSATATASLILYCGMVGIYCYVLAIWCHCEGFKTEMATCLKSNTDIWRIEVELRSIIIKHRNLMRFTAKVIQVSSYIAEMITLVFFISVIMLASIFLMAPNEHIYTLKLITASANLLIIFFGCCYIGEELDSVNHRIKEHIYETQWYTQDIRIQKIILLFLIQNGKRFELRIFKLYKISLGFLLNVVKNCYSVIQILIA